MRACAATVAVLPPIVRGGRLAAMTETLATSLDAVVCADAREAPLRTSFTRLSWQVPGLLLRPVQSECHEDMHYRVSESLVKLPR